MQKRLTTGPAVPGARLLLAHGAGAPMTSPFLEKISADLALQGVQTTRFEFDYMAKRRDDGAKRPPAKVERLGQEFLSLVDRLCVPAGPKLWIGGKSMGGRVASLIAGDLYAAGTIAGLVCLGYPFHPPGRPERLRTAHLVDLRCPALIVQGTRDPLGTREEVETYPLSPAIKFVWLEDGDHDFKPRRASGHTQTDHLTTAAKAVAAFMQGS